MRAAIFGGPGDITVGERPDPVIQEPSDAVVRVTHACVCGSDLWYYRGLSPHDLGAIGHEFIGFVDEIGADVRDLKRGDFVVTPFLTATGHASCAARGGNRIAFREAVTAIMGWTADRARRSVFRSLTQRS